MTSQGGCRNLHGVEAGFDCAGGSKICREEVLLQEIIVRDYHGALGDLVILRNTQAMHDHQQLKRL